MYKKLIFLAVTTIAAFSCCCNNGGNPVDFVDTSIGTGGHGHVFVGASTPFGMVQLGPTSIPQTWDWCSGYHESDNTVIGFSHTHLSGTGIGDLFDITVMPVAGTDLTYARGTEEDPASGLWSYADRSKEVSEPGYYSVPLERYGIVAEMTSTPRVGLSKFTFPADVKDAAIVFDLVNGGCWDKLTDGDITIVNNTTIEGHRYSEGWANDQKTWFRAEFSEPFASVETPAAGFWRFNFENPSAVCVKVALSPVSCEGAASNMEAELAGWDFDQVRKDAVAAWNKELGKIKIETKDAEARTIFYTALYHTMIMPSLFSDCGTPDKYTSFSLWDTYRAAMPLFTMIHPDRVDDVINTFLDIYEKQGDLPVWHLMGCETDCMVGNPGICVAADAYLKGFKGFDLDKAYEAMKATAMTPDRGQDLRMQYGYVPSDLITQSIGHENEYAIADWALGQVSLARGEQADYEYFNNRSHSYRRHFDPETGFLRGVMADGSFRTPFNPYFSQHEVSDYTEGNAWQYLWLVPHDLNGLLDCFGSEEVLETKLDSLFTVSSEIAGDNASPDISGLIGQYAHGNEPSHHITYFYTMLGKPWKTADLVRRVCDELYMTNTEGLSGNEDAGQMSAWYILSSLGMYQVEPAGGRFFFGSPLFDKATVNVGDGKEFVVIAKNNSAANKYIQSVKLNGAEYNKPYIDYADIMAGGVLEFQMGAQSEVCWYDVE